MKDSSPIGRDENHFLGSTRHLSLRLRFARLLASQQLRTWRAETVAARGPEKFGVLTLHDGTHYDILIRDELPEPEQEAIEVFHDLH